MVDYAVDSPTTGKRLFVGNLHNSVTEGDLIKLFQKCGTVTDVNYMWHKFGPSKGQPKGFAFVGMGTATEAANAIKRLNGVEVKSRKLIVSYSSNEHLIARTSRSTYFVKTGTAPLAESTVPKPSVEGAQKRSIESGDGDQKRQRKELNEVSERMRRLEQALAGET